MHITSRRLILSILFILCLSIQASAWNPMAVVSGTSGTPNCAGNKGSQETGGTNGSSNQIYATKYTHSGANCYVNYFEAYIDDVDATAWVGGIYTDNAGNPGTKLAQITADASPPAGFNWDGGALNTSVLLEDGVTYWFAIQGNANLGYHYAAVAAAAEHDATAYNATMPTTFTPLGDVARLISIRVSYQ